MSSALAIAGVTAVLRDLLNDGLINHNVSGVLGSSVTVSVLAPDRVVVMGGSEASQINLFMYLVTPNTGWRNEALPSRDASGRLQLAHAPLALDLHYLLSVYSGGDLHAEILLGYAMQLLHDMPVLTREAIRTALNPSPNVGAALPPALRALVDAGLEDQVEQIKLTPQYLSPEEMSKLWTAMQSHFRPSAAYTASVVLIQARRPVRAPLPVLSRGPVDPLTQRERGIAVSPGLAPPLPMLTAAVPPARQPVARIGDTIDLQGHDLDGSGREALLSNERFGIDMALAALASPGADAAALLRFTLAPGLAATLPVGVYRVGARMLRSGEPAPRETNRLGLTLAPRMTNLPLAVARDGAGTARFTIEFTPALRAGQDAVLVLGQDEHRPQAVGLTPTTLSFEIAHAPVGSLLARLRIDGIESPVIDLSKTPPATPTFMDQRVEIT
ncbi:MAG: Pvc16 family protein [Polaromonas sp.]